MERATLVGWVLLVAGLVLVASAATGLQREVVGRATMWTNVEFQTTTSMELPRGPASIWVEDHPSWPPGSWLMDAGLVRGEDDVLWGDWPDEEVFREIEGTRCFLVSMVGDSFPEGEYRIMVELYELEKEDEPVEVSVYVLSSPGVRVALGLGTAVAIAAIGVSIVVMRMWPRKDPL